MSTNPHHVAPREAIFAGHIFTLPPGGGRWMICDALVPAAAEGDMLRVPARLNMRLAGSFLTELRDKSRWLFVAGPSRGFGGPRAAFADESAERDENAQALARLGVPILDLDAANENLRGAGQSLMLNTY